MILVTLGTQDRSFVRLLKAIEKQIKLGNIKERVVVQAGYTNFQSSHMEIFDLIPQKEFLKLLDECDLLITHGGVGTIIDGLNHHKKIIAAARLKEYGEHKNNHQKQIIEKFVREHYILELDDFDELDKVIQKSKSFKPNTYQSNTEQFSSLIENFITTSVENEKGNRFRKFMMYGFFGFFGILFEMIFLLFLNSKGIELFVMVVFSSLFLMIYRFLMHFIFFSPQKRNEVGEFIIVLFLIVQILLIYFFPNYFQEYFLWKKLLLSIGSGILIYILAVLFHVKDVE